MKNIFKIFIVTAVLCSLQILNPSSVFGQTKNSETIVDEKCTQCTDLKAANDIDHYIENNCRVFQVLCNLNADDNTIVIKSDEQSLNTTNEAVSVTGGTKTNLILYVDAPKEAGYNVKPIVSFVDAEDNKVADNKASNFQQYTFNTENKLYSIQGIQQIKSFKSGEDLILVTKIELPENMVKPVFIKVDLVTTNPLTAITKSIRTYYKQVN